MDLSWVAKYWVEWVFGIVAAALALGWRSMSKRIKENYKKNSEENKALKAGVVAILRDRIVQSYNHYMNDKGHWPIYARDNVLNMFKQYKALGGNGTVQHLMEKLEKLPTDKPEKEDSHD